MERDWFRQLLHFVPGELHPLTVVAGGYAAAPATAGDIDLWVLSDPEPLISVEGTMTANEATIWAHLAALFAQSGVRWLPDDDVRYCGNGEKRLVASIPNGYEGKTVQILVTPARDPQELVDWFDISTHAIAKERLPGGGVRVYFGKGWTSLRETPRVCRWDTPEQTLARLHKITQRYGTNPHPADVSRLVDTIAGTFGSVAAA